MKNVNSGQLIKFNGKITRIAPFICGAMVLIASTEGYAADECGAEDLLNPSDTITCPSGPYPTGITYENSDGLTLTLDDSALDIGGTVKVSSSATASGEIAIMGTNVGTITTTGGTHGLIALNNGTGDVLVRMEAGSISTAGVNAYGINAIINDVASTGTITVELTGGTINTTSLFASGIFATHTGLGDIAVTTSSGSAINTTGTGAHGIQVSQSNAASSATTTITLGDDITAGGDGILVNSVSSGAVLITGNGNITGGTDAGDDGIQVTAEGSVTINVNGTIMGNKGIRVTTADGPIDISGAGDVTGNGGNGIEATISDAAATDNITINREGIISGTGNGILASNNGSGNIAITVSQAVNGGTGYGINTNTTATGNSTIDLNSGAMVTSGIANNAGSSTTNVNGGASVSGNIVLGGGRDNLTIASNADISGVTRFDGGSGGTDSLFLTDQTLSIAGSNLTNWEIIEVIGGTLTITDGALTVGSLNLSNQSVFNAGNILALSGNLIIGNPGSGGIFDASNGAGSGVYSVTNVTNFGTISMQNGATGDLLTVNGSYVGGGDLLLDIDPAADSADKLVITGDVIGGATRIIANNLTPSVATDADGITLVEVGGTAAADAFVVTAGAFNYALVQDGSGNFVLTSEGVATSVLNSTGAVYSAVPYLLNSAFNRLSTLEQRVSASSRVDTNNKSTWMRVLAGNTESTLMTSNTDSDTYALQVGVDVDYNIDKNSHWNFGVTGQAGDLSATVSNADGNASIDTKGYGLGLTATWYGNEGTGRYANDGSYIDNQFQVNFLDTELASSSGGTLISDHSSTAYALSVEAGHRFGFSPHSVIIPQAQLNWGSVEGDDLIDNGGNIVTLGTNSSLLARVGIAYEYSAGDNNRAFIVGNVFRDFSDDTQVEVGGIRLENKAVKTTWAQLGVGGAITLGNNLEAFGQAAYSFGNSDKDVFGSIGIRYSL